MSQVGCVVTHWIVGNAQDKGIPNAQSKNRIRNHMRRYSAFAIAREGPVITQAGNAHGNPLHQKRYDAIIVGAGGHGLATAYYLGKNHGIKNVAILEKGWLGGGNTGRNTTIIRSNYLQDPSAAIYEKARSLYETMSQDLNYNVMFSPRGVMMLAQTEQKSAAMNAPHMQTRYRVWPQNSFRPSV